MDAACVASACYKDFACYVCVAASHGYGAREDRAGPWDGLYQRTTVPIEKRWGLQLLARDTPDILPLRPPHIGDGLPVVGWIFLKTHFFGCGMDLLMNYGHKMSSELWSRLLLTFTVQVQNRWFLRLCRLAGSPVGSTAEVMNRIQLTANRYTFTTMSANFHTPKRHY